MSNSAKLAVMFVAEVSLIGAVGYVSINLGGMEPQIVVPLIGLLMAFAVAMFAHQYNMARKTESTPPPDPDIFSLGPSVEQKGQSTSSGLLTASYPPEQPPGFKFLRVVAICTLSLGGVMIVAFIIQTWRGTLDPADVRRFIPKAAFALVYMTYILRRTKSKS